MDRFDPASRPVNIVRNVAMARGVLVQDILGESRQKKVTHARWEVFNLLRRRGLSLSAIGRMTNKHFTTVRYGLQQFQELAMTPTPAPPARIVEEAEFREQIELKLLTYDLTRFGSVTGPGRSGAVAAVYASHILGLPFIPFGSNVPGHLGRLLIVDTAQESGATLRKAHRRYVEYDPMTVAIYNEPPRVSFWYEARKPQRYRHERIAA